MERFLQVVVDGIADGSIYAALALALVLIFRSTGVVNFAQGEMAMFATFIAWALADGGAPLWLAVLGAFAVAFVGGMVVERVLIRPVEGGNPLSLVIVTLGLFIVVNSAAGWIWGFTIKEFPALFPGGVGRDRRRLAVDRVARHHRRAAGVVAAAVAAVQPHPDRAGDAGRGAEPRPRPGWSASRSAGC